MSACLMTLAAAATLLTGSPRGAADAKKDTLTAGVFLYAAPGLDAGHFTESVVLIEKHGEEGSLGLIVNRPTRVTAREALKGLGEFEELVLPLYFGGPVQPEAILALVRVAKPPEDAEHVLPDVYFSTHRGLVKEAARWPEAESRLRLYAGYAGWAPGQLAAELRRKAWVVGPASASEVFASDPSAVWPRVHDLLRRIEVRVQPPAGSTSRSKPAVGEPSAPNQTMPSATRSISIR